MGRGLQLVFVLGPQGLLSTSIPLVVYAAHDVVGTGLVASPARPGGNITGVDSLAPILDANAWKS
jgi:ABC-type uncharacterized transport system substrate-binding protein